MQCKTCDFLAIYLLRSRDKSQNYGTLDNSAGCSRRHLIYQPAFHQTFPSASAPRGPRQSGPRPNTTTYNRVCHHQLWSVPWDASLSHATGLSGRKVVSSWFTVTLYSASFTAFRSEPYHLCQYHLTAGHDRGNSIFTSPELDGQTIMVATRPGTLSLLPTINSSRVKYRLD